VLPSVDHHCVPFSVSVNHKLAAVTSFYEFRARHGVEVRGSWWACGRPAGAGPR
jgi:hypothetical protein